ncbi:MAG: hypothetical protein IPL87_04630 [Candidatus Moraniibacteriota bacterium]|nr:MAG: hypothetical protein IPL87_04630 [Candidatus Moranbacteria bacterium]
MFSKLLLQLNIFLASPSKWSLEEVAIHVFSPAEQCGMEILKTRNVGRLLNILVQAKIDARQSMNPRRLENYIFL